LALFGALVAVLVLLFTAEPAGALGRQHARPHAHGTAAASSQSAAARKAAARKAAAHRAAVRKAAARKAAAHRAAVRKAAAHRAAVRKSAAARKAAAQRASMRRSAADRAERNAAHGKPARSGHAVTHHQSAKGRAEAAARRADERKEIARKAEAAARRARLPQNRADREQAADDRRAERQGATTDEAGKQADVPVVPADNQRAQLAARAAAKLAAQRLAAQRLATHQVALAAQRAAAAQSAATTRRPISLAAVAQPAGDIVQSRQSAGQPNAGQQRVTVGQPTQTPAPRGASKTGHGPVHRSDVRSIPHQLVTVPVVPIVALATASLSVGHAPALVLLAVIVVAGLLLVAAGTRRSWLRG
jgi:hypothetical protein